MALSPNHVDSAETGHYAAPPVELPASGLPEQPAITETQLRVHATALLQQWVLLPPEGKATSLPQRLKDLKKRLDLRLQACKRISSPKQLTPQLELLESSRAMYAVLDGAEQVTRDFLRLPHIRIASATSDIPRVMALAEGYLSGARGIWSVRSLTSYVQEVQRVDPLKLDEIGSLPAALKLAQLEFLLDRADEAFAAGPLPAIEASPFSAPLHSLRRLNQVEWQKVLEPLVPFDDLLRQDPTGVFPNMEQETRGAYQTRIAMLAKHSDCNEVEVAQAALKLAHAAARTPHSDLREHRRESHIGYFLFAEGLLKLRRNIGYHPPPIERMRDFLRANNEDVYILGIFLTSVVLIFALIAALVPHHAIWPVIFALLLALLPATQGAVDLINSAVSALFHAEALPKLDFSEQIPAAASALVVVPTLLLNEPQVRELFAELEARFLANADANLHFGLLTDLPDSATRPAAEENNSLVKLAVALVEELNRKYAGRAGSFLLLHRHLVFNARQGVWMGWERKRGKLLDLNKLVLGDFDSFPIKAGPVQVLEQIRYVITLDSDTQLPRGAAARMIGTMEHPLNQAIIDPQLRVVTHGFGILQPRVGVSVDSASRSRLAAIYSGETGFDIYTRAVSDVYQDLFGEGIFTGKGIYEVSILHQVLDHRFPRNALLSHDLIEGAYVRAGLVTDIEVIDDYPSRYAAHARRKHRWVRGDWQITQWLFSRVPDESGRLVQNPISTISRWKIFDNLRRSLVEPVTFLLLLLGWFVLPGGPVYWTIAVLLLLLLPSVVQLGFGLGRALLKISPTAVQEAVGTFGTSLGFSFINLAFLPHQMLLSVDAILRSAVRLLLSGRNLLEWETAAQAESGSRRTSLDLYLQLSPAVAALIAMSLFVRHRHDLVHSLLPAAPILIVWAFAPLLVLWLDSSPRRAGGALSLEDANFLREQAWLIWRYFAEFGDDKNHWLIPDNVEEQGLHQVRVLSPTNLGMLVNARQAAYEFGFITLPEFAEATQGTLATYDRLEKVRGHIYNWYDIESLTAIAPFTVSAVDSGNLAASLYTLHAGALELLKRPLLSKDGFAGLQRPATGPDDPPSRGLPGGDTSLVGQVGSFLRQSPDTPAAGEFRHAQRYAAVENFLVNYTPWLLPQFAATVNSVDEKQPALQNAAAYVDDMITAADDPVFREALIKARTRLAELRCQIENIAQRALAFADAMDFSFLLVEARQLLSIGYDGPTGVLQSACYDLLASEARMASFLAVAKGDIPQQAWFRLGRSHTLVGGRAALVSWTGTMFEYMMPALWMRTFPNTLLSRTLEAAARIQRDHVRAAGRGNIPWGISESGFAKTNEAGRYGYQAWGVPALALKYGAEDGPVIAPYATFLALSFLRRDAIANLRTMIAKGWAGAYGMYEAADYINGREPALVRSWMAHHQGMSLLALLNVLHNNAAQRWFHANPNVRAAEMLLHEKPVNKTALKALAAQPAVANRAEELTPAAAS